MTGEKRNPAPDIDWMFSSILRPGLNEGDLRFDFPTGADDDCTRYLYREVQPLPHDDCIDAFRRLTHVLVDGYVPLCEAGFASVEDDELATDRMLAVLADLPTDFDKELSVSIWRTFLGEDRIYPRLNPSALEVSLYRARRNGDENYSVACAAFLDEARSRIEKLDSDPACREILGSISVGSDFNLDRFFEILGKLKEISPELSGSFDAIFSLKSALRSQDLRP